MKKISELFINLLIYYHVGEYNSNSSLCILILSLLFLYVCFAISSKVVFDQTKITMFSYEQAAAVTNEQLLGLSDVQRTALAMVLTPWEDRRVDFKSKPLTSLKCLLSTDDCYGGPFTGAYLIFSSSGEHERSN